MKIEKILSVVFAILAPLPMMITAAAGDNGGMVPAELGFYALLGGLGWLVGGLLGRLLSAVPERIYYGIKLLTIVAGVIAIIACELGLIYVESNTVTMILVPLAAIFCYWFGYRLGSGGQLLPFAAMGVYCVEAALAYPMCCAFEENNELGSTLILIITAALTVSGVVIVNVRHLEQLSWQGGGTELKLSRATLRFNMKKTLTFSAALLFAFLFVRFFATWLWDAVKAFIRLLIELLKNISSSVDIEPAPDLAAPEAMEENDNPIWLILALLIAAVVLILFIKPLIRHIKAIIRRIKERLGYKAESRRYEASYIDIYEESESYDPRGNTFRKAYKAFAKEKDLTVKYRLGYRAFMLLLGRKDENAPSDTTAVHLVRGRIYDDSLAENVIDKYERLRYHEFAPTAEDCRELDRLLKAVHGKR